MDAEGLLLYTFAMRPLVPWSRPEPFGAWVRLDDATLIAVDGELAERLNVPHSRGAEGEPPGPLEVHIAVTSRCNAPCEGCYIDARPDGAEPPLEQILLYLQRARDAGASAVAIGGGEPLVRDDLGRIAEEARALGLVPVMTTSGIGLTPARAHELRAFAQVNVSHDGALGGYRAVRGFEAALTAERAIAALAGAGIKIGANVVLTRQSFDVLAATAERVAAAGASEIQLLRYKPAGRAEGPGYDDRRLTDEQIAALWPTIEGLASPTSRARLRVRIDCSMVPLLSGALGSYGPRATAILEAFGVFGCEAGRYLGAIRVDGSFAPCSFFSTRTPDEEAPALTQRLRDYHASPDEPCRSCSLLPVCRGGCQIVSRHATAGRFAPDPECPRVRAFERPEHADRTERAEPAIPRSKGP